MGETVQTLQEETGQTLPKPMKLGKTEDGKNSSDTSKPNETGDFNFWYLKRKYKRAKQHLETEKFVQLIREPTQGCILKADIFSI